MARNGWKGERWKNVGERGENEWDRKIIEVVEIIILSRVLATL